MTPQEAIDSLRKMQGQIVHGSNIFGEIADMLQEAKGLIEHFGWTSSEGMDVIQRAEKWLGEHPRQRK